MTTTSVLFSGQRFLIAEDEMIIAMLLEHAIEEDGGQVVDTVSNCTEAVAALEKADIDAIILDVHLEGGTSEEVVAAARAKKVPVLICTGTAADALPTCFAGLPVLQKPWAIHTLREALAAVANSSL